jgi:hypothetical protein
MNIANTWRSSPHLRFIVRTVVVAAATYVIGAFQQGQALDLSALGVAVCTAGLTALVGLLTPVEPFVGPSFAKPENVEVPSPPAIEVPESSGPANTVRS